MGVTRASARAQRKRARVVLAELSDDLKALESSRIASYRDALTAADRGIAARAAAALHREDKEGVDILNTHVTGIPKRKKPSHPAIKMKVEHGSFVDHFGSSE